MTHQWHTNILTLFPEIFPGPLGVSVIGKALEAGIWSYATTQIRDYAIDNYNSVDDRPFGGGAGMVMRADILERALLSLDQPGRKFCLSPRGRPVTQRKVREISATSPITLLCGRYEGVDERFLQAYDFEEISIGDYVLAGGEIPAMCLMEACIRLLPGVLGNQTTPDEESFTQSEPPRLEYPQYTRPAHWETQDGRVFEVPDILRSGDHGAIGNWRAEQAEAITAQRRPDLLGLDTNMPIEQEDAKTQSKQHSKKKNLEDIASTIVDCAYKLHKEIGPGLLEHVYEVLLTEKLQHQGLNVARQVPVYISMQDGKRELGFRADLLVENSILVELKTTEQLQPVHKAQTITYIKLGNYPLGFLINFHSATLKDGIRRLANNDYKQRK